MIVSWIFYSLLVAALLAVGAKPVERALRLGGKPGRWAWVGAIAGAVVVPAVSLALAGRAAEPTLGGVGPVTPVVAPVSVALGEAAHGVEGVVADLLAGLEAPLLRLWALASSALLLLFGASAVRLRRSRRRWSERTLDGESVFVSGDVGPAVLGLLRPRIVVPRWVAERGPESRELILAHEREHCRARDPLLVFLAAVPAVLMPWNAPLWWCLSRLRVAVELDCDRRVLQTASPGTRRRYARLLVEVGQRPGGPVRAWAAFSERRSALERRLRALTEGPRGGRIPRAAAWAALGVVAGVAACVVPSPDAPTGALDPDVDAPAEPAPEVELPPETVAPPSPSEPHFTPFTEPPQVRNADQVQQALIREYPPVLRDAGIGGTVNVWAFVNEAGRVQETQIHRSSGHDALDEAAARVAGLMRFEPARNEGEVVPVWISLPVRFEAPGAEASAEEGAVPVEPREPSPAPAEAPPPPTTGDAALEAGPTFTPFTQPPEMRDADGFREALMRAYPPELREAGIGGTVSVWFFIGADGRVRDARVDSSSGHEGLDRAALEVAEAAEFTPAMNRGESVPVWVSIPLRFGVR